MEQLNLFRKKVKNADHFFVFRLKCSGKMLLVPEEITVIF